MAQFLKTAINWNLESLMTRPIRFEMVSYEKINRFITLLLLLTASSAATKAPAIMDLVDILINFFGSTAKDVASRIHP